MENYKFANLETSELKKKMKNYNLVTILSLIITIGGLALYTVDQERYKLVFYAALALNAIIGLSLRTWAIQMKRELKRRQGI